MTDRIKVINFLIAKLGLTDEEVFLLDDEMNIFDHYYSDWYENMDTDELVKAYFDNEVLYCLSTYSLDKWKNTAKSLVAKFQNFLGYKVFKPHCY